MAGTASYSTVTTSSILIATNTKGGVVREYCEDYAQDIYVRAVRGTIKHVGNSGVGNPGDAATRGFVVGKFLAGWYISRVGSNRYQVAREIGNQADHARFVEEGTLTTRKPMAFSWVHARARKAHPDGFWRYGDPAPANVIMLYRRRNRQKGRHILLNASRRASAKREIPFIA